MKSKYHLLSCFEDARSLELDCLLAHYSLEIQTKFPFCMDVPSICFVLFFNYVYIDIQTECTLVHCPHDHKAPARPSLPSLPKLTHQQAAGSKEERVICPFFPLLPSTRKMNGLPHALSPFSFLCPSCLFTCKPLSKKDGT